MREGGIPPSLDPAFQTTGRAAQHQEARPWGRKQQSPRAWHLPYCHHPVVPSPSRGHQLGQRTAGWGGLGPKASQDHDT